MSPEHSAGELSTKQAAVSEPAFIIRQQTASDDADVDRLNARTFGPGRYARSAYRLREDVTPEPSLSFVATTGPLLVGSIIMTEIRCGSSPALLLGPLTVEPAFQKAGIGEALVQRALTQARDQGHRVVLLVGDLAYYGKCGFRMMPKGAIAFCGPVDAERLLYLELVPGSLADLSGEVGRVLPVEGER